MTQEVKRVEVKAVHLGNVTEGNKRPWILYVSGHRVKNKRGTPIRFATERAAVKFASKRRIKMSCQKHGESCYAAMLNRAGDGNKVYDEERFCAKCDAHLSASGICLNACHLSDDSRARFSAIFGAVADKDLK